MAEVGMNVVMFLFLTIFALAGTAVMVWGVVELASLSSTEYEKTTCTLLASEGPYCSKSNKNAGCTYHCLYSVTSQLSGSREFSSIKGDATHHECSQFSSDQSECYAKKGDSGEVTEVTFSSKSEDLVFPIVKLFAGMIFIIPGAYCLWHMVRSRRRGEQEKMRVADEAAVELEKKRVADEQARVEYNKAMEHWKGPDLGDSVVITKDIDLLVRECKACEGEHGAYPVREIMVEIIGESGRVVQLDPKLGMVQVHRVAHPSSTSNRWVPVKALVGYESNLRDAAEVQDNNTAPDVAEDFKSNLVVMEAPVIEECKVDLRQGEEGVGDYEEIKLPGGVEASNLGQ